MPNSPLNAIWGTIREPRMITALYVAAYAIAALGGIAILTGGMQTVLPDGWDKVEGVILIAAGATGAPAAWLGKWWAERSCVPAMLLTATILLALTIYDALTPNLPMILTPAQSVSWVLGIFFWIILFAVRWLLGVGYYPYAPGRGPASLTLREVQAKQVLNHYERVDGLREIGG